MRRKRHDFSDSLVKQSQIRININHLGLQLTVFKKWIISNNWVQNHIYGAKWRQYMLRAESKTWDHTTKNYWQNVIKWYHIYLSVLPRKRVGVAQRFVFSLGPFIAKNYVFSFVKKTFECCVPVNLTFNFLDYAVNCTVKESAALVIRRNGFVWSAENQTLADINWLQCDTHGNSCIYRI